MKSVVNKNTLRGAGSILDILPQRRVSGKNIRKKVIKSDETRMYEAWNKVGKDLRDAVKQYSHG